MIITREIKSKHPIHWHWPLQISELPNTTENKLTKDIDLTGWASRLAQTYELGKGRSQCNILLMKGNLNSTIHQLVDFRLPVQTDVIVFFCDTHNDYKSLSDLCLESIITMARANGVFFTHDVDNIAAWCDELVFHLSHNNNITKSISEISQDGIFFVSPELEGNSFLLNYTRKIIQNLNAMPMDLESIGLEDGSLTTIEELARKLAKDSLNFRFEHESDEASYIASISRSLERTFPNVEFDQENEDDGLEDNDYQHFRTLSSNSAEELGSSNSAEESGDGEELISAPNAKDNVKNIIPRYLQSKVFDKQGNGIFNLLKTNTSYNIIVRIGPSDYQWLQGTSKAPVENIFGDSSIDQELLIAFRSNLKDDVREARIMLPHLGVSTTATFEITTPKEERELIAEISVYHKNRLLQSAAVSAYIVENIEQSEPLPVIRMETLASPRALLNNLEERTSFTSSLTYDAKNDPNKVQVVSSKGISYKLEAGLDKMLKRIKAEIEEVVLHIDDYPEDILDPKNAPLFINLAHLGRELYDNYLKEIADFEGPIQIISSTHEHIPLEFVYTYPAPDLNAKMCPNSVEALKEGKCKGCLDMDEVPAPFICPFGFLCCSKIIERHDINHNSERIGRGDFATFSEPYSNRQIIEPLNGVLFGSADRVENHTQGTIKRVRDKIAHASSLVTEAHKWKDWKETVKTLKPSSLVLMVHTENSIEIKYIQQMELGDHDFLLKTFITEDYIDSERDGSGPLVILIGCNTQENEERVFDFTNQFKNKGAAVVVSNFTKIRGRQAGSIVEKLFEFLEQKKGEELQFGEIMLKLRQYLISKGILVSFSLVAHGDADWKIKI